MAGFGGLGVFSSIGVLKLYFTIAKFNPTINLAGESLNW